MTATTTISTSQSAQARSAAYTLIASGFQYPDRALLETLGNADHWREWPDVLKTVGDRIDDALHAVRAALSSEAESLAEGSDEEPRDLQCRYDNVFGHAVRGVCPAYEMEYGLHEIIRQAADLADVAGFYKAFGLEFAEGADGRPDHISAECEFLGALCAREAYTLTHGEEKNVDICVDAERAFLKDHLARWLPAFCHRVREADPQGLYGALARFAEVFVKAECGHFDIHAGPQTLELRPTDPVADREISCGSTEGGAQKSGEQLIQLNANSDPDSEQ